MSRHPFADRWNHNTHYFPLLAGLVPAVARTVLDVGCGDGTFVRYLRHADSPYADGRIVIGLDTDVSLLSEVRATNGHEAPYLAGSASGLPLGDATIDVVTMTMVLHHVDAPRFLAEARRVVKPGGRLVILGYASSSGWRDLPAEVRDVVVHRWQSRGKVAWEPRTAKAEPSATWGATRQLLRAELPGSSYRRLPMWRYLCTWNRPAT